MGFNSGFKGLIVNGTLGTDGEEEFLLKTVSVAEIIPLLRHSLRLTE